ncbi:Acetylcholine receptor subunit alpha-like [Eumeta japonica]|uniref:Acetylcholine receptor subunit alpha-like n=1 Tax=Eumeta variegata TaxID=151549 RepID=A0A4C1WRC0_EUMVA|nr:Acetylcholine receptor subunit alpha-like [Eumeta japonica]
MDTLSGTPAECARAQVDLRHMDEKAGSNVVAVGVDLSEFYMSVEWDILEVPAVSCHYSRRRQAPYTCTERAYLCVA